MKCWSAVSWGCQKKAANLTKKYTHLRLTTHPICHWEGALQRLDPSKARSFKCWILQLTPLADKRRTRMTVFLVHSHWILSCSLPPAGCWVNEWINNKCFQALSRTWYRISGVNNVEKQKSEWLFVSRWDKVSVFFFFHRDRISALCVFIRLRSSRSRELKVAVYRCTACHTDAFRSCTLNINIDTRLKDVSLTASINLLLNDLNFWL